VPDFWAVRITSGYDLSECEVPRGGQKDATAKAIHRKFSFDSSFDGG
jgi:hypothetical protein